MLHLLLGTDWIQNRNVVFSRISAEVREKRQGLILLVPELITHDTERRLCVAAGDTASRFAEVLSFSRLALRVADSADCAVEACLDNGGRVVAMAAAARTMSSRLKAYAAVETKPEFLTGLVDVVDEFKRCCISPTDLKEAANRAQGSLAQKLEELALLLESYDALCTRGKRDPRDRMNWALEQMENIGFGRTNHFYIDGFPDFTRQHMAILEHLIRVCPHVTVSLNCDCAGTENLAYEKAGQTAAQLLRIAQKWDVPTCVESVLPREDRLASMRRHLFQGKIEENSQLGNVVHLIRTETVWQECTAAAEKIQQLVRQGARYRDISVVCADMGQYRPQVRLVFHQCGIPAYLSGTDDILEKSAVSTILSAMEAAGDLEQRDVLRYVRTALSPLSDDECDWMENYAILWGIRGKQWQQTWKNHPDGLGQILDASAQIRLQKLNEIRQRAIHPLIHLRDGLRNATILAQQVQAVYAFLEEIRLAERLDELAGKLDGEGDNRTAQELNQLWEIILGALEQMYDVLGQTVWDTDGFIRLFRLLLSQYDVGTIPTVLDSVTVGPVSAMRCQEQKHLIVLGTVEGYLPGYGGSAGVLTDQERVALRNLGVPLTGGAMDGLQEAFAEIYGVFCGATETVTVSCPAGQPAVVYRRLLEMVGREERPEVLLGSALTNELDAAAWLAGLGASDAAEQLKLKAEYDRMTERANYRLGDVTPAQIQLLYGRQLRLSASQVDRLAECRFSYFLQYGLRARERKEASVDPAEFGTYVHAVLEQTAREVARLGGFQRVTLDKTLAIAEHYGEEYAQTHFSQLDSRRLEYLFQRNARELKMVVKELWEELRISAFAPAGYEVSFGKGGQMPPIDIPGAAMPAQLRGFVDRVDRWNDSIGNFFRVVDYKTGRKDFDYCDVFNGVGLQMLLYLFALEDGGEELLGDRPIPAGVQYFPARVPVLSADGRLTGEQIEKLREKESRRRGLLLDDERVLQAMEPGETPCYLNYTVRKDGSRSGDLASREQLQQLRHHVFDVLRNLVDEIVSGNVEPDPYTRGSTHDVCRFCPYGAVCHQAEVSGRRNYQAMTARRFWEEIEKEEKNRG